MKNRFTKLTPQVETYLHKKMNQLEAGQIKQIEDKIQLFQDIYDAGMDSKLSEPAQKFLQLLIDSEVISPVRTMELN